MIKKVLFAIVLLIILNINVFHGKAESLTGLEEQAIKPPGIGASSAVLIEAKTGRVVFHKKMHLKRAPASLTKMMTGILAIELGRPQEVVSISAFGAGNKVGSDIGLRRKDKLTLADLTKAALVVSANDSTVAIAEHVGGSEDYFIHLMNTKAKSIGAVNTNFKNTNGYTEPNHYSTAFDLALIARYGLQNPVFARIVSLEEARIKWLNRDKELTLINSNRLQRQYDWVTGVKTGTTAAAGKCLVASGEKDGQALIAVVLNSSDRYGEALELLEYGFSLKQPVFARGDLVDRLILPEANPKEVSIIALQELDLLLTREEREMLKIKIIYDQDMLNRLPVEAGQPVGKAEIYLVREKLAEIPVGVATTVENKPWWKVR